MSQPDTKFEPVTLATWRAQVEQELKGVPFDKALTTTTPEGITLQPLYVEAVAPPAGEPGAAPFLRGARAAGTASGAWRVCERVGVSAAAVREAVEGGAEALWVRVSAGLDAGDVRAALAAAPADLPVLLDAGGGVAGGETLLEAAAGRRNVALAVDPLGAQARRGAAAADDAAIAAIARAAAATGARAITVSSLPYHGAGATAAEELGCALAAATAYLRALVGAGTSVEATAAQIGWQLVAGRDTFTELAKLRAARLVWHKVLAASGAPTAPMAHLHAVSAPRTLTQRDPWVNMLRVTTQVFAAVLGGADCVTAAAYDEALGAPSELGRRVARNTGLVLKHESHLGRVVDPAGGSYYLETLTVELARKAWEVFQAIEKDGGLRAALASGALKARLDASWKKRAADLARRKEPLTGVSEFANLADPAPTGARALAGGGLPQHRDAEAFEALRDAADRAPSRPRVVLAALGPLAEHKARVAFAQNFFAAGGFAVDEDPAHAATAAAICVCGSDERYAAEAADKVKALKAGGARKVLLAGRPGALEGALKEAGLDGSIFVGADVVATLESLMEVVK